LKQGVTRLLSTASEEVADASITYADALAGQIKAALNELSETLSREESRIGAIVSDRPVTTLASAFALGVVVGFALRRA
jgi:hypothetical protein